MKMKFIDDNLLKDELVDKVEHTLNQLQYELNEVTNTNLNIITKVMLSEFAPKNAYSENYIIELCYKGKHDGKIHYHKFELMKLSYTSTFPLKVKFYNKEKYSEPYNEEAFINSLTKELRSDEVMRVINRAKFIER